ncbi:MAG: EF-P 5-aminopentanol modification-associated protein YfmF [Culicoidibacterales bacterium]
MKHIVKSETRSYNIQQTAKFDTISVEITFSQILDKTTVAARNLVSQILTRALAKFPTKFETRAHFADLYAARVQSGVGKNGGIHEITFQFTFADPLIVKDEAYTLAKIYACIKAVIFDPFLIDGYFNPSIVTVENRIMQEKIKQLYDDKMHYAQLKLVEKMFANTPFSVKAYGELADYNIITNKQLIETYDHMIGLDNISVFAIGNIEPEKLEKALDEILGSTQKQALPLSITANSRTKVGEATFFTENQKVNQAKLHIGYQIPVTIKSPDYIKTKIAIDVLGSGSQSKLFQEVREKASLAYYASASMDAYAQAMYIYAGVDEQNLAEAQRIIELQIQRMQLGEITEEELAIAKITAKHRIIAITDSPSGCISLQRTLSYLVNIETIEQWLLAIEAVTIEDVKTAASDWKKDTVFILLPEEKNEVQK